MSHDVIYYDEAATITDEMLEELDMLMPKDSPNIRFLTTPRRSWFRRHEGKILLIIIVLTLLGLYLILPYIPTILWNLSTPLTHLLGGQ